MTRFLIILIFINKLFAQVTLEECSSQAIDFNSKEKTPTTLSTDCYPLLLAQKSIINYDESSDGLVKGVSYNNIFYSEVWLLDANNIPFLDSQRITAGHSTMFHSLSAIRFNAADAKFYLLNKIETGSTQILSFFYDITGNLNPITQLESEELNSAYHFSIMNEEIFVISKENSWIKVFNKNAHPKGTKPNQTNNLLRHIWGISTELDSPVDILIFNNEIFILDNNKILVFDISANGAIAPKRKIQGTNTLLNAPKKLEINNNGEIEITNGNNNILKYPISSQGNISPI